ncbi:MAG: hypothetical protein AB8B59_04250 [Maribacter sp.]
MNNFFKKTKLTLWVLMFFTFASQGQEDSVVYYNVFDEVVGIANTNLYQGVIYTQKYRTINDKTPFYTSIKFLKGSVVYDGQPYHGLDLKYDIFEDQLLLKLNSITSIEKTLQLKWDYIDEFEILGHRFVKLLSDSIPTLNYYGFYEKSLSGSYFSMYQKFRKKRIKIKDTDAIYYEFIKSKSEYVLHYKSKYHLINSRKEVVALFPQFKKEIHKFYGTVRNLRSNDMDSFMVALMKKIESLIYQIDIETK